MLKADGGFFLVGAGAHIAQTAINLSQQSGAHKARDSSVKLVVGKAYLPWSCRPGMLAVYAPLGAGSGTYLAGGVRDLTLPLLLARKGGGTCPCLPSGCLHNAKHWPGKGS